MGNGRMGELRNGRRREGDGGGGIPGRIGKHNEYMKCWACVAF